MTSIQPVDTYFARLCNDAFVQGAVALDKAREETMRGTPQPARLLPLYGEELRRRAKSVLEAAKTALATFQLRHDQVDQEAWVSRARELVAAQASSLNGDYGRYLARRGFGFAATDDIFAHERPLQEAHVANMLRRHFWDLEHIPQAMEKPTLTQNFNIQGPVGAILTGDHATANVSQTVAATDLSAAIDALLKLRAALATEPGVSESDRPELLDSVDKATAELSKGQPALDRVMTWLAGVAGIVQAIPAIQPAWEVVKATAGSIGISI